jgi:molybdopterin/thiamine biosynthesis adenylyltransferase/proteasome lid subunit RPN8/RPN11
MIELVLSTTQYSSLFSRLTAGPFEECAVVLTRQVVRDDGLVRLLAAEVIVAQAPDYLLKTEFAAELAPKFVAMVTKTAKASGLGIVFVHSHPGRTAPRFSEADDQGEKRLSAFLSLRHPGVTHGAMVVSLGGMSARKLGTAEYFRVIALGETRDVLFDPEVESPVALDRFDRQVRAFGATGQAALSRLRVGIVGLGGTGSLIVQQLAHLGVEDFLLIDPDILEYSNLNRVAFASKADVGMSKVSLARNHISRINSTARVATLTEDITRVPTAKALTNVDVIFGCTDSHGSRAVIQQLAYQFMIPCIDMGTVIVARKEQVTHVTGRVQLLAPGLACFTCGQLLDSEQVRRDMLSEFERQMDPYIIGDREPAPAVISINSSIASIAVTMLLSLVAGVPMRGRHVLYNAVQSTLRTVLVKPDPSCFVCSTAGALGQGNLWPIMGRNV